MPGPQPPQIELSEGERSELEGLVRAQKTPQVVARRARVVLLAAMGYTNVRKYAEGKDDWREAGLPLEAAVAAGTGQ